MQVLGRGTGECDAKTDDDRQGLLELARTWTHAALVERQSINRASPFCGLTTKVQLFRCDRRNSDRHGGIVLGFNAHLKFSLLSNPSVNYRFVFKMAGRQTLPQNRARQWPRPIDKPPSPRRPGPHVGFRANGT